MERSNKRLLTIACTVIAGLLCFTAFKLCSVYQDETVSPELKRTLIAAMQTVDSAESRQYLHEARLQARTSLDTIVLKDFDDMLGVDDYLDGLAMTNDLPDHESSVMQGREDKSKEAQLSAMRSAYVNQSLRVPETLQDDIQRNYAATAAHRAKATQTWTEHCDRLIKVGARLSKLHTKICQELRLPPDLRSKTEYPGVCK